MRKRIQEEYKNKKFVDGHIVEDETETIGQDWKEREKKDRLP